MTGLSIADKAQAIHAAIYCSRPAHDLPGRAGEILAAIPFEPDQAVNACDVKRATGLSVGTVHPNLIKLAREGYIHRREEMVGALKRVTYWRVA